MSSLAPQLVVGNLRLTEAGVYAEYLLSGVPFIFLSEQWQNSVAADHAELWRTLPSGSSISGLTVPVLTRSVLRTQLALLEWDPGILPVVGADGDYGDETANAVVKFKTDELKVHPGNCSTTSAHAPWFAWMKSCIQSRPAVPSPPSTAATSET
jgi:hypothetical protein